MTAKTSSRRDQLVPEQSDASIERFIVLLGTWGATIFFAMVILAAVVDRDPAQLIASITPAAVAGYGWFMLWRAEPRAAPQLVLGMIGLVASATFSPEVVTGNPVFGMLVMSIIGTVLTRHLVVPFAAVAIGALALTSVAWEPAGAPAAVVIANASVAVISYVLTAGLLVYLKRRSEQHQRELRSIIRSKDQFVATVSHELRTPLTTIVGLALELEDRYDMFSDDEIREFISMLVGEGTDVANIVEDLLVAARADIGTLALTCDWLDLEREIAVATGDDPNIPVHSSGLRGTASVYADGLRFRQIIRNLVANAVRYGGTNLRIVLHGDGDMALIEVRDDGLGIPVEDRELIFEPYYSSARSGALPGSTGLGLTVSRRLARLMDGDLTYRHDGTDSVFTLRLPASFAEPRLAAAGA